MNTSRAGTEKYHRPVDGYGKEGGLPNDVLKVRRFGQLDVPQKLPGAKGVGEDGALRGGEYEVEGLVNGDVNNCRVVAAQNVHVFVHPPALETDFDSSRHTIIVQSSEPETR